MSGLSERLYLAKNKSVSLRLKAINTAKETVPHLNTHCHC